MISGYNVYDGPSVIKNVHWENFVSANGIIDASVFDIFGGAAVSTKNTVMGLSFKNPAIPTFRQNGGTAGVTAQVNDADGSVTGRQNGQIILAMVRDDGATYMDPLRDSRTCTLQQNKVYFCGAQSSGIWVVLDNFKDGPSAPVVTQGLPNLLIKTLDGNARSLGDRTIGARRFFSHQYEMVFIPGNRYEISMEGRQWMCFSIALWWGSVGERYHIKFVNTPLNRRVRNAKRVNSRADLQRVTETADFHDGSALHVAFYVNKAIPLPGYDNGQPGHAGSFEICF
jgi:hypothetical protein